MSSWAQIDDASTSLAQVRRRLLAYEEGHAMISSTLELGALPALHLHAVQTTVLDESEIGPALTQLLATLRDLVPATVSSAVDLVLIYDGRAEEQIVVSAGHPGLEARAGLHQVDVPAEPDGVTVTFPDGLSDVGDAWIALDARLAERDLRSTGIYRQVVTPAGLVRLQAPVRPRQPSRRLGHAVRSAEPVRPGIQVQHRQTELLASLGRPVGVEGVLDRVRPGDHHQLVGAQVVHCLGESR